MANCIWVHQVNVVQCYIVCYRIVGAVVFMMLDVLGLLGTANISSDLAIDSLWECYR